MRSPWMSSSYRKLEDGKLKAFKLNVDNCVYQILLNPELGSWVAFNESEYDLYMEDKLNELQMENLYLRGLATDDTGNLINMNFPEPSELPSVVVVNITTVCNLKCKYCFVECEPSKLSS